MIRMMGGVRGIEGEGGVMGGCSDVKGVGVGFPPWFV